MKVELRDVLNWLYKEADFYSREIARRNASLDHITDPAERVRSRELMMFAIATRNAYRNAADRLDLELGYGLGRYDDQ